MNDRPKTFAENFCIEDARFYQILKRDIRLLGFIFRTFLNWFKARKVRAEFKQARDSGQPFYVDRFGPRKNP